MANLPLFFILFPLLNQCRLSYGSVNSTCSSENCQLGEPVIRFPFRLKPLQNESCGYPGFDLSCNDKGHTVINLPVSGEFRVEDVDYLQRKIVLRDPDDCLLRRLPTFTTSGSRLRVAYYNNLTFLNCSNNMIQPSVFKRVSCPTSDNYSVWVTRTDELYLDFPFMFLPCANNWTVLLPSVLGSSRSVNNIGLTWHEPACGSCFERFAPGHSSRHPKWLILIGITTTFTVLIMVVSCHVIKKMEGRFNRQWNGNPVFASSAYGGGHQRQTTDVRMLGMDSPTIASYPIIKISENAIELQKIRDDTCAICLLEYRAEDTVKIIPECNHYFHDHCIDQWLRSMATCPLCRKQQQHKRRDDTGEPC